MRRFGQSRYLLAITAVVCCAGVGFALPRLARSWTATSGGALRECLEVEPSQLRFGDSWENQSFKFAIPVRNSSGRRLRLDELRGHCECTTVEPHSLEIAPGGTAEISATFDLSYTFHGFGGDRDDTAPRPFQSSISAVMKDVESSETVAVEYQISGRVQRFVKILRDKPKSMEIVTGRTPFRATLDLACHFPMQRVGVVVASSEFVATVEPVGETKTRFIVHLVPSNGVVPARGEHHDFLRVSCVGRSGEVLPELSLPFDYRVVDEVRVEPPVLQIGLVKNGEVIRRKVVLTSRLEGEFTVESIAEPPPGVTVTPLRTSDRRPKQLEYEVAISVDTTAVQQSGMYLTFVVQTGKEGPPLEVRVPIVGITSI